MYASEVWLSPFLKKCKIWECYIKGGRGPFQKTLIKLIKKNTNCRQDLKKLVFRGLWGAKGMQDFECNCNIGDCVCRGLKIAPPPPLGMVNQSRVKFLTLWHHSIPLFRIQWIKIFAKSHYLPLKRDFNGKKRFMRFYVGRFQNFFRLEIAVRDRGNSSGQMVQIENK